MLKDDNEYKYGNGENTDKYTKETVGKKTEKTDKNVHKK